MDAVHAQERTTRFVILTGLTLTASIGLLVARAHPRVGWPVLLAIAVPWVATGLYLQRHRDGVGGEGKYVDWWSIPHVVGGVLLGLLDISLFWVVLLVVWWECVESVSRVFEHLTNRVTDVVIAITGWAAAQWLVSPG